MITKEEWENLKVGDEIYLLIRSSVTVHTYTVINIRVRKKKTLQTQGSSLFLDYNCFSGDYFFVNKQNVINRLITNLNTEIHKLNLALENAKKQLEQNNGE